MVATDRISALAGATLALSAACSSGLGERSETTASNGPSVDGGDQAAESRNPQTDPTTVDAEAGPGATGEDTPSDDDSPSDIMSGAGGSTGTDSGSREPGGSGRATVDFVDTNDDGNQTADLDLPPDGGGPATQGTDPDVGTDPDAGVDLTNTCSEAVLRTGPPSGKEMFGASPVDATFPFSVHWIGSLEDPRYVSMTSLTDLDNDGDLDFASGQRSNNGGSGGMFWWEYCSPDHWVYHYVGSGHDSVAGGNAVDADQDGWVDLIAGDTWYRNPQNPRESEWQPFPIGAPAAEEVVVGEVTGADPPEALYVWRSISPQFWTPGEDPTSFWIPTELTPSSDGWQQQGGAIGDLDGDGDNDILVGYRFWYENVNGDGSSWRTVEIFGTEFNNPYDSPLAHLGDLDGDGDTDFAVASHFGGAVAWAENLDGRGTDFSFHELETNMEFLHAIVIADFDNDADLDIFVGQNVGPSYIFENTDGQGSFSQHLIAEDVRMHEARVGDVDCDGDLDIAGKPWGDPNEGGEANLTDSREHVYLQNQLVDRGGPARFERGPYEEQHRNVQRRVCP
jgi:hypothetical protein